MTALILIAGAFCALAALLHIASIIVVIGRTRARPGLEMPPVGEAPGQGISIVRPVCGIENFSKETLASTFQLGYPLYEIIFCAAQNGDPVVPLVRQLIAAHPHIPARLLIGNDRISQNPKLNNICKGWRAARYPWIVMADSNVLMPRDYLQRMLAAWQPGTGLVCSPPVGSAPAGLWAELECAFLNTYQVRWQCFADSLSLGFAQGKSMLWRREILDAGGGLRALAAEVAEDAASTKIVNKQGLRVRLLDQPFEQPLGLRTATEVWQRQIRWARLRRDTFKSFFAVEILAGGLPPLAVCVACTAALDGPVAAIALAFVAAWYGAEALLAHAAGWHLSWRSVALWMLRDGLLPVLWLRAWTGDDFVWRGNAMQVASRGSTP